MSISGSVISSLLMASVLLPGGALAEPPPSSRESRPQMEMKRRQLVVHPRPDREVVAQDARRAADALEAAARRDARVRDATRRRVDRPDLEYDVYTAIH